MLSSEAAKRVFAPGNQYIIFILNHEPPWRSGCIKQLFMQTTLNCLLPETNVLNVYGQKRKLAGKKNLI